uniref:Uncharacterized protein n=1 Tax=Solanum lycopersicum TaxID=4081 RepID=A0A3Q7I2C9_SOLLC
MREQAKSILEFWVCCFGTCIFAEIPCIVVDSSSKLVRPGTLAGKRFKFSFTVALRSLLSPISFLSLFSATSYMDSSPYSCTSKLRHIGSIFVPISRVRPIYLKAVTGSRDPTTCWKLVDKCSKAQEMGCIHEVYYIYALIYRFMATNVWPEVQKYRDEINNRPPTNPRNSLGKIKWMYLLNLSALGQGRKGILGLVPPLETPIDFLPQIFAHHLHNL